MIVAIRTLTNLFRPETWAGPIFTKELRVASRRRRIYLLRSLYLLALLIFIVLEWASMTVALRVATDFGQSSQAYSISQMAEVGRAIVSGILWFQFVAAQVVAVFLLGGSVYGEVRAGTLGVLMTTPIRPFQIVLGKLLGGLLQVMVLLCVSLPLLALVRVFGGVSWQTVVSGLCVTLTAAIFVGSMALWMSCRQSTLPGVFVRCLLWYVLLAVISALAGRRVLQSGPSVFLDFGSHSLIMLAFSLLFLRLAAGRISRIGFVQAARNPPSTLAMLTTGLGGRREGAVRSVRGGALVWKDMRFFLPPNRRFLIVMASFPLGLVLLTYVAMVVSNGHTEKYGHIMYLFPYLLIAAGVCALMAATSITAEKESRALPILLTAPIGDREIIFAKAMSVFRRVLPMWGLTGAHLLVFGFWRVIHPLGVVLVLLIQAYVTFFLIGLGMYWSSRARTSSNAVMLTIASALAVWLFLPLLSGTVLPALDGPGGAIVVVANPFVQLGAVLSATAGSESGHASAAELKFSWPGGDRDGGWLPVPLWALVHAAIALCLLWRAKANLRRNLFSGGT